VSWPYEVIRSFAWIDGGSNRLRTIVGRNPGFGFGGFGADRRKTASCCRKARIFSRSWAEVFYHRGGGAGHGEQALLRQPTEQMKVDQLLQ
jgi:hypothetical protein